MINYIDEPPSQRALKKYFIDQNIERFPQKTLNCVAYMILTIDNPEEMMDVALAYMVDEIGACRADMGYLTPEDKIYHPNSIYYSRYASPSDCEGVVYSNQTEIFQKAWRQPTAVTSINIHNDQIMSDSRHSFEAAQTESVLFQRLSIGRKAVGLACIDFTQDQHIWTVEEVTFISEFCQKFLGPLAGISQYWHGSKKEQVVKRPSTAELSAIKLAAKGMSYKQIANELNKSSRTIENQLRSAREALNATNQADLIRKCMLWLDS
tara:strand:- start:2209 stop:3003 length:795 start_codon:yes stop_codon:yes gene_type:complete